MMRELEDQSTSTATTETVIISALSTLTESQLSYLTDIITAHLRHCVHRLSTLISSPILFSHTLRHLHSLSLSHKSLLISRHLLFFLRPLTVFSTIPPPSPPLYKLRLHDCDAVLILLLLCELHQNDPTALEAPQAKWRELLSEYFLNTVLTISGVWVHNGSSLVKYVDVVARYLRLVGQVGGSCSGCEEVAASSTAVIALPSVEVRGSMVGSECVICREDMREGRDVCQLPCQHLFHWMCILPWLRKRNTCPCCRFLLPSDDVYGEIQRLWGVVLEMSDSGNCI